MASLEELQDQEKTVENSNESKANFAYSPTSPLNISSKRNFRSTIDVNASAGQRYK